MELKVEYSVDQSVIGPVRGPVQGPVRGPSVVQFGSLKILADHDRLQSWKYGQWSIVAFQKQT